MLDKKLEDFIKIARKEYKKIGYVECSAFSGEKIFFNKHGFNHLIRKKRKYRDKDEQIRRLALLPQAKIILISSKQFSTYKISDKDISMNSKARFWSFIGKLKGEKITVIVRQINSGNKHFFSIF